MEEITNLEMEDIPEEFKLMAQYISEYIVNEEFFDTSKYNIFFAKEKLENYGYIWRIYLYECKKYLKNINRFERMRSITEAQIVSIYYDLDLLFACEPKPYFEIYNGHSAIRYTFEDYKKIYETTCKWFKERITKVENRGIAWFELVDRPPRT